MVVVNYYIDRNSLFLQPLLWIFVTVTLSHNHIELILNSLYTIIIHTVAAINS